MKKAILTLIIVCILWVHTTSAMMPEVEEKFIQTSEGILSNLENNQTFSRNADSTSLREKILNPDFLEAEKFIDSLWLSEEDTTVLKHYNIHKNQQPLIGVPVLSGEEAIQELEELKKKHIQSLFSSRSPILPSYYNRNAAKLCEKMGTQSQSKISVLYTKWWLHEFCFSSTSCWWVTRYSWTQRLGAILVF